MRALYCFARPTHTYLDFNARDDFEREIVVKVNAPELVRAELAQAVLEGRPRRARHEHRPVPVGRGPLPADAGDLGGDARLREPVLGAHQVAAAAARPDAVPRAGRSGPSSSPTSRSRRSTRRRGARPSRTRRIPASASRPSPSSIRAGIPTGVLVAPLMPGVNDDPSRSRRSSTLAGEAGARSVGGVALHLRGEVREIWFDWLRQYRPDLVERYERLYAGGAPTCAATTAERLAADGKRRGEAAQVRGRAGAWSVAKASAAPRRRSERAGQRAPLLSRVDDGEVAAAHAAAKAERRRVAADRGGAGERPTEPDADVEERGEGPDRRSAAPLGDSVDDDEQQRREQGRERGAHRDRPDERDRRARRERDRDQADRLHDSGGDRAAGRADPVGQSRRGRSW